MSELASVTGHPRQVKSYYYWQLVSRSARLGLQPLIMTHCHILALKGYFSIVLCGVSTCQGGRACPVQGSRSLYDVYIHTLVCISSFYIIIIIVVVVVVVVVVIIIIIIIIIFNLVFFKTVANIM
jgi:hypothetical protein